MPAPSIPPPPPPAIRRPVDSVPPPPPPAPTQRKTAVNPFAFSKPEPPPPVTISEPVTPKPKLSELRARSPGTGALPRPDAAAEQPAARPRSTGTAIGATSPRPGTPNTALLFGTAKKKKDENVLYELRYWLLSLALAPLIMSLFQPPDKVEERVERTLKNLPPDVQERLKSGRVSSRHIFELLPDDRIEGALLPHDTWMHWAFALFSAAVFWSIILGLFPRGNAEPGKMLLAGLFTGTIGILFLLVLQTIALVSAQMEFHGGGKLAIILILLKIIGYSYECALNPNTGFLASFFGFTFGVGFCEELCKGFTLLIHFKRKATLDWRGACVWGLACGVGFGVSEGIMYSSGHYNGVFGSSIYLIRFISCVALHAIWSAASGISFYRHRHELQAANTFWGLLPMTMKAIAAPMIMHGAYDTLLKEDMPGGAVLVAIATFGWLAYQIERAYAAAPGSSSELSAVA